MIMSIAEFLKQVVKSPSTTSIETELLIDVLWVSLHACVLMSTARQWAVECRTLPNAVINTPDPDPTYKSIINN